MSKPDDSLRGMSTDEMKTMETRTVVIAWTEASAEWDGVPYRVDLGEPPTMLDTVVYRAAVWALAGDAADLAKAKVYAATLEDAKVFTFSTRLPDPLGEARALLAEHEAKGFQRAKAAV